MVVSVSRRMRMACFALVALLIAGCSRGTVPPATAGAGTVQGTARNGSVRFVIKLPRKKRHRKTRLGKFLSPATQSVTIAITGGVTQLLTANLTPTSAGCASTLATTICTLSLGLPPGTYSAAVSTFDGLGGNGTLLSAGQALNFNIVAGTANDIAIMLDGIPHSLILSPVNSGATSTGPSSFKIIGVMPVRMLAEALDADGNIIAGAGSPTFAVTQNSGAFTITNPLAGSPNTFELQGPGGDGASGAFTVTASYPDDTCSQAGAVCTTAFTATTHVPTLFVANNGAVGVYAPPYTGAPTTLSGLGSVSNSFTGTMAVDASGDLFTYDSMNHDVKIYAPPYTGIPTTIGDGTLSTLVIPVTIGPNGLLFVGDTNASTVFEYAPPYTGAPTAITNGINRPGGIAFDGSGNLFVANFSGGNVNEYAPPYTDAPTLVGNVGAGQSLAVTSDGNVFAANWIASGPVYHFTPPYTGSPAQIPVQNNGVAAGLVIGPSDRFYFSNTSTASIYGYASPYSTPSLTLGASPSGVLALAFDIAGNLFAANQGNKTVNIYAPPYTGTPLTVSNGVNGPSDVVTSP
jgi:serine/threonine-protein kinase